MLFAGFTVVSCMLSQPGPIGAVGDSLVRLFEAGRTWAQFVEGARARREAWRDNYADGRPDATLVERARAAGAWRIVAVAEDWCFDSVNTLPYLVRLAEAVPAIEIRIVSSAEGRWLMKRHPTPDGRAATPTIVIVGPDGEERGCFIERPAGLRTWVVEKRPKLSESAFQDGKAAWYRNERGRETTAELVRLLEAAARGEGRCR